MASQDYCYKAAVVAHEADRACIQLTGQITEASPRPSAFTGWVEASAFFAAMGFEEGVARNLLWYLDLFLLSSLAVSAEATASATQQRRARWYTALTQEWESLALHFTYTPSDTLLAPRRFVVRLHPEGAQPQDDVVSLLRPLDADLPDVEIVPTPVATGAAASLRLSPADFALQEAVAEEIDATAETVAVCVAGERSEATTRGQSPRVHRFTARIANFTHPDPDLMDGVGLYLGIRGGGDVGVTWGYDGAAREYAYRMWAADPAELDVSVIIDSIVAARSAATAAATRRGPDSFTSPAPPWEVFPAVAVEAASAGTVTVTKLPESHTDSRRASRDVIEDFALWDLTDGWPVTSAPLQGHAAIPAGSQPSAEAATSPRAPSPLPCAVTMRLVNPDGTDAAVPAAADGDLMERLDAARLVYQRARRNKNDDGGGAAVTCERETTFDSRRAEHAGSVTGPSVLDLLSLSEEDPTHPASAGGAATAPLLIPVGPEPAIELQGPSSVPPDDVSDEAIAAMFTGRKKRRRRHSPDKSPSLREGGPEGLVTLSACPAEHVTVAPPASVTASPPGGNAQLPVAVRNDTVAAPASDPEWTYDAMLARAMALVRDNNPALVDRAARRLKPPQVMRVGSTRSAFVNAGALATSLARPLDHVLQFFVTELGTTASIDGSERMILRGRFSPKAIEAVLVKYIDAFVRCGTCRTLDTTLERDAVSRLSFMACATCGASRSVAVITAGFHAVKKGDRRKIKDKA